MLPFSIARILGAASLLLSLAACINLTPDTHVPPLPVADQWPADTQLDPASGGVSPPDGVGPEGLADAEARRDWSQDPDTLAGLDWSHYFQDPVLHRVIGQALEHNRDLQLAVLRVREAEAMHRIERADLWPSLGAQSTHERAQVPADLSPTGQAVIQSRTQATIGLSHWEIDLWGRIRSLNEAALETWLATDAARQSVQIALVRQVADAVLTLRALDERARLAQAALENRTQWLDMFERRVAAGSSSALELTQARTLLIQAQSLSVQLEQERAAAAHALALLVGADPQLPPAPDARLAAIPLATLQPGLPSSVLLTRPDIRAAEFQLRAAHAHIGAARAAFLPRIALSSAAGTASAELDGLFAGGSRVWTFIPVIEVPIFTAGRLKASLNVAEVRRDMAVARYEQTIQSAFREVSDALSARYWLAEQLGVQADMARTQAERARLAQLRYDRGAAPYLEVLDAERALLTASQQLVQTRLAWLSSQVALYAALGGGATPSADPDAGTLPPAPSPASLISPLP